MGRRRNWLLATGLVAVLAAWFVVKAVETWQFRTELARARRDLRAQQFDAARVRLARLARRWPGQGEVEYPLGTCESMRGHSEAALAAWGRVPDRALEAPLAALSRGELAIEAGRYRLAETCLERVIRAGGDLAIEARRLLGHLHWITGRHGEYRNLLQREFDHTRDPAETLRLLWSLDHEPYPIEGMRDTLDKAGRMAPDDDRVWLAQGDLATRSGHLDEADAWIARCEQAQPDDPAVWNARLAWAQAAGRSDELMRAARHLPASDFSQRRVLALVAWLAGQSGDRRAEREALEKLVALDPDEAGGLERLAALATEDGEFKRLAELRRRKAERDDARDHYATLVSMIDPPGPVAELARAAEALGRSFDAQAWWKLAARQDRGAREAAAAALTRLAKAEPAAGPAGRSLADVLGPLPPRGLEKTAIAGVLVIPNFTDEATKRGVTFTFNNGITDFRRLPETMSGGVAVADFDGDGWLDIYAVQGGPFPPPTDSPRPFDDRLFRNRGDGSFEDATAAAGLASLPGGYGHGVAVGDYDNDGRPDLFVTRWRSYSLYHNLGQGCFENVTASAGLGGNRDWPTSAAWADLDNDGDLDLYVCHYLEFDPATAAPCYRRNSPEYTYCSPRLFPAVPDHVFRNDRGRFVDVTAEAGIVDHDGRGLGVVAADLDEDGRTDLFVANDTTANYFFRNRGGFRFVEEGVAAGLAANAGGGYLAGMGVACGDFDGDGRLDVAVTNFLGESTTLYHNHGDGLFTDRTATAGLTVPTRFVLGFGIAALDANNDGRLDLAQANGNVVDYRPALPYEMAAQIFLGDALGRFTDVSVRAGAPWQVTRLGRGLAVGDLDNDGRIDLLLVADNIPLALLHNRTESQNHFITFGLEGTASNRDAVGARVAVTVSGRTQVAARFSGGSYLSASDPRLHFGLGAARKIDRVEVTWPSGRRECHHGLAADAGYRLIEGDSSPQALVGFASATAQR